MIRLIEPDICRETERRRLVENELSPRREDTRYIPEGKFVRPAWRDLPPPDPKHPVVGSL
jgi:hypothetical protein